MERRQFLAGTGAIYTTSLVGCSTFASAEREGVVLTHVELVNGTNESHLFHLLVQYDDEIIHWSDHEVGVGDSEMEWGSAVVAIDAPDEPGIVEIHSRVGDRRNTIDFDSEYAIREYDGESVIGTFSYGTRREGDHLGFYGTSRLSDRPISGDD